MRKDLGKFLEDVTSDIRDLSGTELEEYLYDLFKEIGTERTIELDEENELDIVSSRDKIDLLDEIFKNIESEDDKQIFLRELLSYEKYLGYDIINYFKDKVQVPEELEGDSEEENEEPEEEQELETPSPIIDSEDTEIIETNVEEEAEKQENEKEEEKEPIQPVEGPAITEYKEKTAAMEKELEELEAKLNDLNSLDEDSKKMEDIINNTSYPEIEEFENEINLVEEEIKNINSEIESKLKEKQRYEKLKEEYNKFYEEKSIPKTDGDYRQKIEIYDKRIKDCDNYIKSNQEKISYKEQELATLKEKVENVSGPLYMIKTWEFSELYNKEVEKLENNLKEIKEIQDKLYKELKSIPLELYAMQSQLETQIQQMENVYNDTIGIRSEINLNNPEFKCVLDEIKNGRKLNDEINKNLNESYRTETQESNLEDNDLKEYVEKIKEEIEKRKENEAKYYDALNDIKNIEKETKSGKTPEELKQEIEKVNNKIETITDDKLKEELREELNKSLNPDKEKEETAVEKPGPVKKDPNKWKKWLSGIAGFALGAGIIALTPLGLPGAIAIAAGSQVVKKGVNKLHEKLKNENEVTNIEKTGKLAQFKEKIKSWLKDENIVKNINWFLNGTAIGAVSMGTIEYISSIGSGSIPKTLSNSDNVSNIKVGDSANGLDMSKGYDTSNWAINKTNAETLNQGIMNDGKTVIRRIVDAQGNTYMSAEEALKAGKTLEELSLDLATNNNLSRAYVNAAEAVGRTL